MVNYKQINKEVLQAALFLFGSVEKEAHRKLPKLIAAIPAAYMYVTERKTKKLSVNIDVCVGCGVCAKKCPVGAIRMEDGCPVWKAEECEMCLGCLHRCPKFAINYGDGKTDRHGQYKNPYTRI